MPRWTLLWRVGGTETDTLLYDPGYLAADPGGLYVYDGGRYAVVRLDLQGRVRWMYGHRGKDPDGFSVVRDLKVDREGRAWVLDPTNARITVLTPQGAVERRITGEEIALADKLAPLPGGRAVLMLSRRERRLVFLDADGRPAAETDVPWPGLRELSPLAAHMTMSPADASGMFAVAFTLGDGFFVFRDTVPRPYHGAFVEHVPFPKTVREEVGENVRVERFDTRPVFTANSLWIADGRLYVHFGGRRAVRHATLDVYEADTGRYLHSVRLPRGFGRVEWVPELGRLYAIAGNPYPGVEAWAAEAPAID